MLKRGVCCSRATATCCLCKRPTLASTPTHTPALLQVNQALLKEDDDLLRQTFLSVFREHHPQLANKVDVIFALAQVGVCRLGGLSPARTATAGRPAAGAGAAAPARPTAPYGTQQPSALSMRPRRPAGMVPVGERQRL